MTAASVPSGPAMPSSAATTPVPLPRTASSSPATPSVPSTPPAQSAPPTAGLPSTAGRGHEEPWLRRGLAASADLWLGSRVAVLILSLAAARALFAGPSSAVPGVRTLWNRWDVVLYAKVARYGYLSPKYTCLLYTSPSPRD